MLYREEIRILTVNTKKESLHSGRIILILMQEKSIFV